MPTADRFSEVITHHGEGPVWDARSGTLRIVDLMAGDLVDVDGRLDLVVEVDAAQVTACTFGGPTLDRLMITTSRQDLGPGEDPAAGSLFVLETGTHGLPPPAFAG